ncbi:hypothetical protein SMGD1_1292 [Sulfurimonas gotlandica GD1]|uniref:Uncharacterized protein n=1 Tax=Sulfurimonas gotlandica (strain DSM 19862 / JCM 16533 / GD1) TaxID=929558 RepID=H1FRT0_SULGG|nr:hypothetical protein SMGD1_1292 [Sulfurimonas gotlandica GD1]
MIANTFPLDAKTIAFKTGISFAKAATNATSDEKGKIVAARNAEKKRANSVMKYSQQLMR